MLRYVAKRLLLLIPIVIAVSFIVFFILDLAPGDPAKLLLGPLAPREAIEQLHKELGLDDPMLVRLGRYLWNALRGDFGNSYRTSTPVFKEVLPRFPATLTLAFWSVVVSVLFGIPLGILSAVRQYSKLDTISTVSAMFISSIPDFWLGLMLLIIFALRLGWFPTNGVEVASGYVLPTLALALPSSAQFLRFTRTTMLETIRQDYIRTARAKGAAESTIIWKHALRNALLPILTLVGSQFGYLLGGSVVVETVFAIPGLGNLTITAIKAKDMPVVMAAILFLAVLFALIMLAVDLAYAFIDPRIRSRYTK